ncbi:hypothetical protein RB620_22935 [Paenibacillus sp. LHD-117]|uniref:hypothetical protein n=1 Tax=Paenibacillus sp. LHD-117 TaxID=3071412 RepID=UPI0027E184A0|nr:hypothetical protein [Paenibacillus sp. LHD-117]MDQ6422288.1 hypothetical protein [Paenibacillus sp. LHD-117]
MPYQVEKYESLSFDNVASYRERILQNQVNKEFNLFMRTIQSAGAKKNGPLITTTHQIETTPEKTLVDVEFLVPLDRSIPLDGKYKFKPTFKIAHSLKVTHYGDPRLIEHAYNHVVQYIEENNLNQITSFYNISRNDENIAQGEEPITDIMVGINPSIL